MCQRFCRQCSLCITCFALCYTLMPHVCCQTTDQPGKTLVSHRIDAEKCSPLFSFLMSDNHCRGRTCVCNLQHKGAEISYDKPSLLADGIEPMAASQQLAETEAAAGSSSNQDSSAVNGIPLSIPYKLRSADDLRSPFTNYVRGYSGLLDYIWYEPQRMKVERAIPLPSLEEVKAFIPSERFPSDHLSVSTLMPGAWCMVKFCSGEKQLM